MERRRPGRQGLLGRAQTKVHRALLLLHLLAVIAYLGPSLGGSFVYWRARRSGDPALLRWALRQAVALYRFEHLMLVAVLLTGAGLWWQGGWALLAAPWFRWKLGVIAAVLLPVEVWDVWAVSRVLAPALRAGAGAPPGTEAGRVPEEALRAHELVLTAGGVLFTGAALAILWLSVAGKG